MPDIVERLRKFAGLPPQDNNASLWALEAADEIERLRAEVKQLSDSVIPAQEEEP